MNRNQVRRAISALINSQNIDEDQGRGASQPLDECIFRHYVADKKDVQGIMAYGFYKFQKIKCLERNANLSQEERQRACQRFVLGRSFADNNAKAELLLSHVEREAIAHYLRQKTKRDLYVGVWAGVVAAVLAPIIFSALLYVIKLSGVATVLPVWG